MRFAFIDAEKTRYPMRILCRVLRVSQSGYYAWRSRKPSARNLNDERLRPKVVEAFKTGRGTYGRIRVRSELIDMGFEVGMKHVARLMREMGLQGISPRKFRVTTDSNHVHPKLRSFGTQRKMDDGYHLHLDKRGLALPGDRDGSVLAADRGLVDGRSHGDESLSRCALNGARPPNKHRRARSSLGPWGPICEHSVPICTRGSGHRMQYESSSELLG
jgi:transposase InsO family protein